MKKTSLALSLGFAMLVGGASLAHAQEGLRLHVPFDEGAGTAVSARVGTSTGVIQGAVGWASGKIGNALGFKGETGQSVGLGSSILSQSTQGTLAVWVKPESKTDRNVIFALRDPNDNAKYFALTLDLEGRPLVKYRINSSSAERMTQGSKTLDLNTWYQIVVAANSERYFMYLNGEMLDVSGDNSGKWITDSFAGPMNYTAGSVDATPLSGSFAGMIDDIRVYDHALSQAEVTTLYTTTNDATPTIPAVALPQIALSASDGTVPYNGSVKITWSVSNADSCTASWGKPILLTGEQVFTNLIDSKGYGLTCLKTGGATASQEVSVTVLSKAPVSTTTAVISGGMTPAERQAKLDALEIEIKRLIKLVAALVEQLKALPR